MLESVVFLYTSSEMTEKKPSEKRTQVVCIKSSGTQWGKRGRGKMRQKQYWK